MLMPLGDEVIDSMIKGPSKCVKCGRFSEKWIEVTPIGGFCVECAQHTMRILLEDLIRFHHGDKVSLEKIMYHGR